MSILKKGSKLQYKGYTYTVIKVTETDVQIRRGDSKSNNPTATLKIGSDRFKKMFLGSLDAVYDKILATNKILDVEIDNYSKSHDSKCISDFDKLINDLEIGSKSFNSKTEATVWCMDALNSNILEARYREPLYAVLSLYYGRTSLTEICDTDIESYMDKVGFRDKYTDFRKFTELALNGGISVKELYTYIPDDYEAIVSEFMLGKVKLNVVLSDLKYILNTYKRNNKMKIEKLSDNTILELSKFVSLEVANRGLSSEGTEEDAGEEDLAELLDGVDVKEVLDTVKEVCSSSIRATKKVLGLSPEDLAELLEDKLDEEDLQSLIEALNDADYEEEDDDIDADDDDEDEEDEDLDADEDDEEEEDEEDDDEDADEEDDEEDFLELLEGAMSEDSIVDILEEAGVELSLTAKQKKFDAEAMAELLEKKLDEEELQSLIEHLESLQDDEDEDDEDEDDDISIDDLDDDEVLELAEEEGLKIKLVKGKASSVTIKKLRKQLKDLYED